MPPMVVPIETRLSAWDKVSDPLKPGDTIAIYMEDGEQLTLTAADGDVRLIELGIPEFHIICCKMPGE